jgi:uncharacterized repeat protein (TIGR01451 family)
MHATHHYSSRPVHAPAWFRYSVVALAVIVLCSCRSSEPSYRVAGAGGSAGASMSMNAVKFQSPDEAQENHPNGPHRVTQWIDANGAVHKTTTPIATPTIKQTIRGQSPEQDASTLPSEVRITGAEAEFPSDETIQPAAAMLPQAPVFEAVPPYMPGVAPPDACGVCAPGPGLDVHGPSDEYLCDGGDFGTEAAVVTGGNVIGLEQEDAIAHYDTIDGRTIVTPSNKVCIYAPRFAAVRQVVDLRAATRIDAVRGTILDVSPIKVRENEGARANLALIEPDIHRVKDADSLLRGREHAGELDRERRVAVTLGTVAAYANLQTIRTGEVIGEDIVRIARSSLAAITWSGDQAAQVLLNNQKAQALVSERTPGTIYLLIEPNNPKLRLIKLASTDSAHPGDEVEFTLRFDNVGDRVIGNVTILDSLTTRLEYIEGTQKCSEQAQFEARVNEGDSLKLRWMLTEPLKPGEGGVIQFRCRVR